jgi:periplasmic divalent cation tolerance protein
MSNTAIVYSTVPTRHEARIIGRVLVTERLVACANVLPGVTSVFRWDEAVQEADEVVLLLKTRPELVETVMQRVRELHRYECPCVLAWEADRVSPPFQAWLDRETSRETGSASPTPASPPASP